MDAGVMFTLSGVNNVDFFSEELIDKDIEYETKYWIVQEEKPRQSKQVFSPNASQTQVFEVASAARQTLLQNKKNMRYRLRHQETFVSVSDEGFLIVNKNLKSLAEIPEVGEAELNDFGGKYSQATAINKLHDLENLNSQKYKGNYQVIAAFEKDVAMLT
jgi:hypothetical protein